MTEWMWWTAVGAEVLGWWAATLIFVAHEQKARRRGYCDKRRSNSYEFCQRVHAYSCWNSPRGDDDVSGGQLALMMLVAFFWLPVAVIICALHGGSFVTKEVNAAARVLGRKHERLVTKS